MSGMETLPLFDEVITRPAKAKDVQSSSREAYKEISSSGALTANETKTLRSLDDYSSFHSPSQPTTRELHLWMYECGRAGMDSNQIQPRLSEAEDKGFARKCPEDEKRKCRVTGKRVFTWSLTAKGKEALKVAR
jgi:hypothetical protein